MRYHISSAASFYTLLLFGRGGYLLALLGEEEWRGYGKKPNSREFGNQKFLRDIHDILSTALFSSLPINFLFVCKVSERAPPSCKAKILYRVCKLSEPMVATSFSFREILTLSAILTALGAFRGFRALRQAG